MPAEPVVDPSAASKRGGLADSVLLALWSVVAAFGTYAYMYGFRKPFTAGTYSDGAFPVGFKVWLVTAQVLGYTISKFIGIRVIAEMPPAVGPRCSWA